MSTAVFLNVSRVIQINPLLVARANAVWALCVPMVFVWGMMPPSRCLKGNFVNGVYCFSALATARADHGGLS